MGLFPLIYEIGMGVECYTLILSIRKVKYSVHLHWGIMSKYIMAWSNPYETGECGSRRTIFDKYEGKLVATYFPTREPWLVKFMRGYKLRMGIIRKQDFGISVLTMNALQRTWDLDLEDGGESDG